MPNGLASTLGFFHDGKNFRHEGGHQTSQSNQMSTQKNLSTHPSAATALLSSMIGTRLTSLIRYSWWPAEEAARECRLENSQVFSLTAGPLALEFDNGRIIGLGSDPGSNSVIIWLDVNKQETPSEISSMAADNELFPISASDKTYSNLFWASFPGLLLTEIGIITNDVQSSREQDRPSEIGLLLGFENGHKFIASHGMHDTSDDFSVLTEDQIAESIKNTLTTTYV